MAKLAAKYKHPSGPFVVSVTCVYVCTYVCIYVCINVYTSYTYNIQNNHKKGISLDKLEFKTDGRILGEASLDVDSKLKLWVSAEDGCVSEASLLEGGKEGGELMNGSDLFSLFLLADAEMFHTHT